LEFRDKLNSLVTNEGVLCEQPYNYGKTGFNFKIIQFKTLGFHEAKLAPGFKRVKGQVMLIFDDSSASGNH
jgi:hypothetical protein